MNSTETIVEAATQLSEGERVQIIERLLETLEPPSEDNLADVQEAWRAELKRRSAELRNGQVTPVPWHQVRDDGEKMFDG